MNKRQLIDYGELKLFQILDKWRNLKNDRDICWGLESDLQDFNEIFKEFMDKDE